MNIPDNVVDLVKLAIAAGDVYSAAAVYEVATGLDKKQLETRLFGKRRDALLLARWEHTPTSVLQALANNTANNMDSAVVVRLDKNPNTPSHALSKLYADGDKGGKASLSLSVLIAQHRHTPLSVLESIAKFDDDMESLLAVSKNPVANADVLSILMARMVTSHKYDLLKKNVAANPSATSDLLEQIYFDSDAYTRAAVIGHVNCPQSLIAHAVNDDDVLVMRQLAADSRVSEVVLARLAVSKDHAVRVGVAANLAASKVLIRQLIHDDSDAVRRAVAARLDLTAANVKCLMSDSDHWVRLWLARNLTVSRKVLERLAVDHHADVRRAVARNPSCPIGLLKVLAKDEIAWVRSAVAYQRKSPTALMLALAEESDIDVLSGVASNQHTPQRVLQRLTTSTEADVRRGVILNHKAARNTLLPLLEDPYYLHRLMLVASTKLKDEDKWHLHEDPDFQVRFVVFRWFLNRLNKVIVQQMVSH
ncbi:MAG: hypothetical protein Q8Q76_10315 [Methylotenera sp.]|nr:hypothetical protein [Methylotenera sp.]